MLQTFGLLLLAFVAGFFAIGGTVHFWFHVRQRERAQAWKHQPGKFHGVREMLDKLPWVAKNSAIIHGSLSLALTLAIYGHLPTYWTVPEGGWTWAILSSLALPVWYHGALYFVHRAMHRPFMMKHIHHVHHSDRAPMFLDALVEHPIEAVWGAIVLTLPLYVVPLWGWGFVAYVSLVGFHEILDHAGVKLDIPLLSRSHAHDEHHRRCDGYYGQLLPWLDRWQGTDKIARDHRPRAD